jgi:peptidoglycan/xylan/chitin deacetylase (PgdA/CDA1 family)
MKSLLKTTAIRLGSCTSLEGFDYRRRIGPTDLVVNYHGVVPSARSAFRDQLEFLNGHYPIRDPVELFDSQREPDGCRLFLTFDDGLASQMTVVSEVLRELGHRAIAFLPAIFQEEMSKDKAWALGAAIRVDLESERELPRPNGTWPGWRDASEVFDYGSHTITHRRLDATVTNAVVRAEVVDSKAWLEDRLEREVRSFAWVGGEISGYHPHSLQACQLAPYDRLFGTGHGLAAPEAPVVQRFHLDPSMSCDQVAARLSSLWTLAYWPKRARIGRRLRG